MTDFEKVIDFENMYRAYRRAKSGKGYKKSAAKFNVMVLEGIHTLIEQLKDKTYQISPYNEFKVYEPKERVIQTTSFKDKVVQHSLSREDILKYSNGKEVVGWHISDLVIYDKPKELWEFQRFPKTEHCGWGECDICKFGDFDQIDDDWFCRNIVTRPPQSWCYVEGE